MNNLNIVLAALAAYASAASQSSLSTATRLAAIDPKTKNLEASSEYSSYTADGNWGFTLAITYDISAGYDAELLSFIEDDMLFLAMNPNVFIELWAGFDFSISTSFFVGHIYLEFVPASFVPLDF